MSTSRHTLNRFRKIKLNSLLPSSQAQLFFTKQDKQLKFKQQYRRAASSLLNNGIEPFEGAAFDVVVVGGGHAGCEAAAAAARVGSRTCLITQRIDTVGELSCNPSVGGIGKGHLVREIDALDGLQSIVADEAGIHYRLLNRRKGPAVRGPRAQMDRDLYKSSMQRILKDYPNLSLMEASVQDLLIDESSVVTMDNQARAKVRGVVIDATQDGKIFRKEVYCGAVVVTTGTFLRGVLMIGHDRYAGGRHLRDSELVEPPSTGLAKTLERYKFPLGRMKTGTPARIDGNTIDWSLCKVQPTDNPAQAFSHLLQYKNVQPPCLATGNVIDCYQTATNEKTHELVMKYEHTLPQYDGLEGKGNGPRYCPSIYKKVQRFPDRLSHNTFLEPEGLKTNLVYPNGMSGPYPEDVQLEILRSMKGLENVEIVRPGYDVEYDFINPQGTLKHTMETNAIAGLYLAGQICGTTGYEEAAAQGIVAGANAGKAVLSPNTPEKPFIIGRDEGYIGVLIDDLVTRGTTEPYRMFTSRSEYRISLRADNADLRLTKKGADFGLVKNEERIDALSTRQYFLLNGIEQLQNFKLSVKEWAIRGDAVLMGGDQIERKGSQRKSAEEILMMPHVTLQEVEDIMMQVQEEKEQRGPEIDTRNPGDAVVESEPVPRTTRTPAFVFDTVEATVKYQSYVRRQSKDMESWRKAQGLRIPADIIYSREFLPTFSAEELEKLQRIRPNTFSDAAAISGITPHSLVYLYHYVTGRSKKRDQARAT